MDIEPLRDLCLGVHPAVVEGAPFSDLGHPDIAFTIAGKIFANL